ncbi:hypothetical protein Tco_1260287, partial [Tanacetum coccineum]
TFLASMIFWKSDLVVKSILKLVLSARIRRNGLLVRQVLDTAYASRMIRRIECQNQQTFLELFIYAPKCVPFIQTSQTTAKAARLLRRLSGYYEGCQATTKAARLLPRLLGCCEGCQAVVKAARLLRRLPGGFNIAKKASTLIRGLQRLIVVGPTDDTTDCAKRGTYQASMVIEGIIWRQLWRSWQRSWVAVMEIMPIDQLQTRGGISEIKKAFEEKGVFEEKARGLLRTQQRNEDILALMKHTTVILQFAYDIVLGAFDENTKGM